MMSGGYDLCAEKEESKEKAKEVTKQSRVCRDQRVRNIRSSSSRSVMSYCSGIVRCVPQRSHR